MPTVSCDIESIARSRGLVAPGLGNVNLGVIIRANAIRLVLQARGIAPSSNPSGFSDVDGKLTDVYVSYIAKAREIGCIQGTTLYRPFDPVTEGEFAKMAVCSVEKDTQNNTFNAAPKNLPTSVISTVTSPTPNTPTVSSTSSSPSVVYYGGGGGGSTTIINNYSSGIVGDFTSTGTANFNIANFSGVTNFASLPSLPLSYGALYV